LHGQGVACGVSQHGTFTIDVAALLRADDYGVLLDLLGVVGVVAEHFFDTAFANELVQRGGADSEHEVVSLDSGDFDVQDRTVLGCLHHTGEFFENLYGSILLVNFHDTVEDVAVFGTQQDLINT